MKSKLHWSDGLIFHNDRPIGDFVKNKTLSCEYQLNKKRLQFEQIDLSRKRVAILDKNGNRLGMIYRSRWSKSAKIELMDNSQFELKPAGLLSSKWKLCANDNELIEYDKSIFKKGEINYLFKDELLILAGLYVITD